MDRFWHWLMRANAKAVLVGAVAALLAVAGWWGWREFRPARVGREVPPVGSRNARIADNRGLALLRFVSEQLESGATQVPGNPFMSSDEPWHWRPRIDRQIRIAVRTNRQPAVAADPRPIASLDPPPVVEDPAPPPVKKPAPPPVKKPAAPPRVTQAKPVRLIYRGWFRRPDGAMMALIEDSESNKAVYYGSGDELFGVKLLGVDREVATVETLDGLEVELRIREQESFVDGRRRN